MKRKLGNCFFFGSVLLASTAVSAAQTQDTKSAFQSGIKAARQGDYAAATEYFESAEKAGLSSAPLFYNLGVSHYQLGNYREAATAFRHLLKFSRWQSLARYNLGLVALKEGNRQQARTLFLEVEHSADDPRLRDLARRQGKEIVADPKSISDWLGSVSVTIGHDDALVDPAQQTINPQGDAFTELFGLLSVPLQGSFRDGWRVDLSGYTTRYQTFDTYDMTLFRGAVVRAMPRGPWTVEIGGELGRSTFGQTDYLAAAAAKVKAVRRAGPYGYRLHYRFSLIDALDPVYDPQQGTRQDLGAEARRYVQNGHVGLGYELELNDRQDLRAPGVATSYSPTRHIIALRGEVGSHSWRWRGQLQYRLSDYRGDNITASGLRLSRRDNRVLAEAGAGYHVNPIWEVRVTYSYADNRSNIDTYDYQQNLYSLGVSALF